MDKPKIRDVAQHKWRGLLLNFGLTERQLSGKHCPCPICGGSDRFRFDDKDGRGTWICSHCGAGDGIKLLMAFKGWDFRGAAKEIEQVAGVVQEAEIRNGINEAEKLQRLRRVWDESEPLRRGDEAMRYIAGRGLSVAFRLPNIRLHPGLPYYDECGNLVDTFPVMLARVAGPDGNSLTLHRTFLMDGRKAPVDSVKKLMPGKPIAGGAVRLGPAAHYIGIAEGIETALAASEMFCIPVWSCISANGIETFEPPPGIEGVVIFADNDKSFTGQRAAYVTAFRIKQKGIAVEVRIPEQVGDWLDVLNATRKAAA